METENRQRTGPVPNLIRSFSLKLLVLALISLAVPLLVYWQFQDAEQTQLKLLRNSAAQTGRVIAAMLRPRLRYFKSESPRELGDALKGAAVGNTNVKILVRPAKSGTDDFIYVAAFPQVSADFLEQERRELVRSGIFARLAPTCDGTTDLAVRFVNPKGKSEILTSMTPVHVSDNCWIVITSQSAADLAGVPVDVPFWSTSAMRVSAGAYALSIALILWLFTDMWGQLGRFRTAARQIRLRRTGTVSFSELNTIPELARVAGDFDTLVGALSASQDAMKRAAEENAHALKTPLAIISQSLEPLKAAVEPSNAIALRSLHLIESSVARLDVLITSAHDLEQAAAVAVYPEVTHIDISAYLKRLLAGHEVALAQQGKRLVSRLADDITIIGSEDLIEIVVENLLDNAASYTQVGQAIEVELLRRDEFAHLIVSDRGPGVPQAELSTIFDRYVSNRAEQQGVAGESGSMERHKGLGLWIVKRNVEGIGGIVTARNRRAGGFEVTVALRQAS